eukprot:SAG31_NODE_750_length_12362_cov_6.912827_7_plen_161_part_00
MLPKSWLLQLLVLSAFMRLIDGVIFRMDANGQQCISEDAGSEEVLVYVQYNVTSKPDDTVKVSLEVTSREDAAKGKQSENIVDETDISAGKVTFISDASEEFRICFTTTSPSVKALQAFAATHRFHTTVADLLRAPIFDPLILYFALGQAKVLVVSSKFM